ncbi:MAG: N-acetylglutaminylglutamine amidotransferase [Gammaproteobacteria bacterium]|nr:N-acetylglutaminylglutamine amidotransferase [Gammaproteobacteria bacterium]
MCGIAGEISFDGSRPDIALVAAMTELMTPRGPDGDGVFARGQLAFGHRRLKIIDLSDAAHQPMHDAELGLTIVFNGCIYNYPELRAELEGLGYHFFSHGDTEVILKAWHAWGPDCVHRLYGMFAFCLWEQHGSRAHLVRDRLGIKPLYYHVDGQRLRFASSLPAMLKAPDIDTSLDPVALHHYLSFHSVVPAPRTIIAGVRKLPPATIISFEADGRSREKEYWRPTFGLQPGDEKRSFEDWQDETLAVMRRAVERRLVADVPVGVLLSGGLDSSLVVGLLAEAGQQGLATFSIGFEAVDAEKGDEFQYSDIIAERFATNHHKIFIDASRTLSELPNCVAAMSEPMVSHDCIGFYLLSEEVAKHVRVVQSGQGADEIFAGYHWYPPMMGSDDPLGAYRAAFFDRDHDEMAEVLDARHLGRDESGDFVRRHFARPGADAAIDKALRLDTQIMLIDDPVKRVDNMTMAWGLEARVPFLDHEVVELAARVPAKYKVPEGGKYVLKEAARRVIPAGVIDRPKGYFPVPALKYLRGPYLQRVRDVLTDKRARERGLFNPAYVEKLLADPEAHITPLRGSKLWQLTLLEYWLQTRGL